MNEPTTPRRKPSLGDLYKRLFLSKRTAVISAICAIVLIAAAVILGSVIEELTVFDYFDTGFRLLLVLFLFYGYMKHNLLTMQAGCCALLVALVYYQANYVLTDLIGRGSSFFMSLGFWGSFFLACQVMVLILEAFFALNHFETFILKKCNYLRIVVNQTLICVLLFFLLFLIFVITRLAVTAGFTAYFAAYDISLIATYALVACSELILAIDAREEI